MKKFLLGAAMAASTAVASAPADAAIFVYVDIHDGMGLQEITTTGPSSGNRLYAGVLGQFEFSGSARGFPTQPQPQLSTTSLNTVSTGAGTIDIYVVQTGLSAFSGDFLSSFTSNQFLPPDTGLPIGFITVNLGTYYDLNGADTDPTDDILIADSSTFDGFADITGAGVGTDQSIDSTGFLPSFFAESTRYTITFAGGGGSTSNSINLMAAPVPEPATWAMMLTGFGAVGYSLRRRKSYRLLQAV